jgi:hypothetical protein
MIRVMRGLRLIAVLLIIAVAAFSSLTRRSSASYASRESIVGSYSVVYHETSPVFNRGVDRDYVYIDSFDPSSGAITGHGGPGDEIFWPFLMTGYVKRATIEMRVADDSGFGQGTGVLTGSISPTGTITGTFRQSGGGAGSGTWTMTPLHPIVVVAKSGFSEQYHGHQESVVTWGLVLANRSRTRDAAKIGVDVKLVGENGKVISDYVLGAATVTVIPAAQTYYLGGGGSVDGRVSVQRLLVSVTVGLTPHKRYGNPTVSNVRIDRATAEVTATVGNPFSSKISGYDLSATMVLYDRAGNVIGGQDLGQIGGESGPGTIAPGGQAPVTFVLPEGVSPSRVASARISVGFG